MKELRGRVAVVTGGGSGIGRGIALALADAGMQVVVADVQRDPAESVAREAQQRGAEALALHVDVAQLASVEELAERAYRTFGEVHVLCNNAGVDLGSRVTIADTRPSDWDWVLGVNLRGVVNGLLAFLPRMRQQVGQKHVVNTASHGGLLPVPGHGAYTASKFAVVGLSETLALELADEGFGVTILCPGPSTRIFPQHSAIARTTRVRAHPLVPTGRRRERARPARAGAHGSQRDRARSALGIHPCLYPRRDPRASRADAEELIPAPECVEGSRRARPSTGCAS